MTDIFRRAMLIGQLGLLLMLLPAVGQGGAGDGQADQGASPRYAMATYVQDGGFPAGVPVEVLHSGSGFALRGNDSFLLRLNVESLLPLKASRIESLLQSNKSLEEIREDIQGEEGEKVCRGSLTLDRRIYPLVDIQIAVLGNNTTSLKADVAWGEDASQTATEGNVSVTISPSEGGMIGRGELYLAAGSQAGRYALLLDMEPRRHGREMKMGR